FGFRSAVQKQRTVAVSGSLASSVSLHVVLIGTGFDVPPCATFPMLTAVLLIAVLLSVTVQPKSPVPPVFWATYCTVSASAATLVPFTVNAFQPSHDAVPSSLLVSKPTSTNGPAPHLICLSTFTLHVSHVSCAVAVSVFGCPGLFGSTDPTMSHVTETVLQESCVSPVIVPVPLAAGAPTPRSNMFGFTDTGLPPTGRPGGVTQLPPGTFVSVTLQFARAAVPEFVTVIVTALLPLVSRRPQSSVTVSPGV